MSACHQSVGAREAIEVRHTVKPTPVRAQHALLVLELVGHDGKDLGGAQIQVELDMAHPGMAPKFSEAKEGTPGHYSADLDLDMAGDWVVVVKARLADGRRLERQFALQGVQP